ncbi:juvenile hormone acid O-methyltransferase-like [Copidosoma floridanum]|uniref:juvenile hormone acid O-methyltransferase-like n=1 Tax=Copidosoma floridanum TaxID=29053 RepID=UPI0006C9A464|nr:juvenile hormone acid O-methyltransferase-like [Copidosoma floridanum]
MNNNVKEYIDANDIQTRDDTDLIEEFSDELAKMTGKCIDIGCGPALVARNLLMPRMPADVHIVGADISKEMVKFAKQTHSDEKRLSFIELDVEAEKIPKELICAFDNAVSFYCLHWCQKMNQVFGNIYKLLRPGGRTLVLFLAYHDVMEVYLKMFDIPCYKQYMTDVAKYIFYFQHRDNPEAEMKKILKEAGFKVLHCSLREKLYVFKSLEITKKHFMAINPFVKRMPKEIAENFANDLMREFVNVNKYFNDNKELIENGKVYDRYRVLVAYVEKPNKD